MRVLTFLCFLALVLLTNAKKKVYVYDLPAKFNYDLYDEVSENWVVRGFDHWYNGLGSPAYVHGETIRKNDQYTFEIVIHQRMLSYEHRVFNKSEADLFYVPFYLAYGLHKQLVRGGAGVETVELFLTKLIMDLLTHLRTEEGVTEGAWNKHFIALGREEGMFNGGMYSILLRDFSPFNDMLRIYYRQDCRTDFTKPWEFDQTCGTEKNLEVVVAPQVAIVHATKGETFPWTRHRRHNLITFVGNDRRNRSFIVDQLKPENCPNCILELSSDPRVPDGPNVAQIVDAYTSSHFCLHPWGDGPLRRGIYDSITLGCIPVFFLQARKPWDTFIDYTKFSLVLQPEEQHDIVAKLKNIPILERVLLRSNLEKYAQYFQYSFGVPPIKDAYDTLMEEVSYIADVRSKMKDSPSLPDVDFEKCRQFVETFAFSSKVSNDNFTVYPFRELPVGYNESRSFMTPARYLSLLLVSGDEPADTDGDGVPDASDTDPNNSNICQDTDSDTCDDCSVVQPPDTLNDGLDTDGDGLCDAGDPDIDGDSILNGADTDPLNPNICQDVDNDGCDDCSVVQPPDPSNDGPDTDGDGICDPPPCPDEGMRWRKGILENVYGIPSAVDCQGACFQHRKCEKLSYHSRRHHCQLFDVIAIQRSRKEWCTGQVV